MAYCTTEAVTQRIPGVDLGILGNVEAQAAALEDAAEAATLEVDRYCRRTFQPPTTAETRHFAGAGGLLLRVDDMVRLDSVMVDGTIAPSAAPYPVDGPPYLWIATGGRIPSGTGNVEITALWGYGITVPDDIARAAACLAAADMLCRIQADRSGGVRMQVTGLAREEFPDGGPYGETMGCLTAAAGRILLAYRRWVV